MIDPWGTVIAECPEGEGVIMAEIDLKYLDKVRTQMPVQQHRRHDLYGNITVQNKGMISVQQHYRHDLFRNITVQNKGLISVQYLTDMICTGI